MKENCWMVLIVLLTPRVLWFPKLGLFKKGQGLPCITKSFQKVVIGTDFANVYSNNVNDGVSHNCTIEPIVKDIRGNLKVIPEKIVRLIDRNANIAADWVATQTTLGKCSLD
ncbi:hypothetical protein DITRI_Ditri20bG0086700 [Diplodiscus trichospermus]